MMAQLSPTPSGTSTPNNTVNLEALDFGHPTPHPPRPFKSAPTKQRALRRNKNLKQILQDEQKALAALAAETMDTTNGSNTKASVRGKLGRTLRVEGLQWGDIDAPPSLLPQKKYCDITGLESKYTDPKTKLRYHNTEVYAVIQTLPASIDQQVVPLYISVNM
jgi:INO80 complex subunit C